MLVHLLRVENFRRWYSKLLLSKELSCASRQIVALPECLGGKPFKKFPGFRIVAVSLAVGIWNRPGADRVNPGPLLCIVEGEMAGDLRDRCFVSLIW